MLDTKEIPGRGASNVSAGLGICTSIEATGERSFPVTTTTATGVAVTVAIVAVPMAVVAVIATFLLV